jgi:hypothetical protein
VGLHPCSLYGVYFLYMSSSFLHRSSFALALYYTSPQTQIHSIPFRFCTPLPHTYNAISHPSHPPQSQLTVSFHPPAGRLLFDGGSVQDYLTKIKTFLDANPNDVLTLLFTSPESADLTMMRKEAFDGSGESNPLEKCLS